MKQYHKNPRQITQKQYGNLADWLGQLGDLSGVVHDLNTDEIIGGNQRSRVFDINNCEIVLAEQYAEPDKQGTIAHGYVVWQGAKYAYRQVCWTPKQCEMANIVANKAGGTFDFDILANEFEIDELLEWGFESFELGLGDGEIESFHNEEESEEGDGNSLLALDIIWATDNNYGVPVLMESKQAHNLVAPVAVWGNKSRKARHSGTWLFYTDDYRFEALWKDPSPVVSTEVHCCAEPNFSVFAEMPTAVAMWQIYRKRWIARWWQSLGVEILVDLNVAARHAELNMLGVPNGWKSYVTRGYSARIDETIKEYEMACSRAGSEDILFVVYGGGKSVENKAHKMGWVWIDEVMNG